MPLDKVDPVGRKPATQYVVETADAGRRTILSDRLRPGFLSLLVPVACRLHAHWWLADSYRDIPANLPALVQAECLICDSGRGRLFSFLTVERERQSSLATFPAVEP